MEEVTKRAPPKYGRQWWSTSAVLGGDSGSHGVHRGVTTTSSTTEFIIVQGGKGTNNKPNHSPQPPSTDVCSGRTMTDRQQWLPAVTVVGKTKKMQKIWECLPCMPRKCHKSSESLSGSIFFLQSHSSDHLFFLAALNSYDDTNLRRLLVPAATPQPRIPATVCSNGDKGDLLATSGNIAVPGDELAVELLLRATPSITQPLRSMLAFQKDRRQWWDFGVGGIRVTEVLRKRLDEEEMEAGGQCLNP